VANERSVALSPVPLGPCMLFFNNPLIIFSMPSGMVCTLLLIGSTMALRITGNINVRGK
uniref:Transport protein n=1 Tax=Haemonchus contortus TaxID=6289 RepID=A0A7I4Y1S1_HAECO